MHWNMIGNEYERELTKSRPGTVTTVRNEDTNPGQEMKVRNERRKYRQKTKVQTIARAGNEEYLIRETNV